MCNFRLSSRTPLPVSHSRGFRESMSCLKRGKSEHHLKTCYVQSESIGGTATSNLVLKVGAKCKPMICKTLSKACMGFWGLYKWNDMHNMSVHKTAESTSCNLLRKARKDLKYDIISGPSLAPLVMPASHLLACHFLLTCTSLAYRWTEAVFCAIPNSLQLSQGTDVGAVHCAPGHVMYNHIKVISINYSITCA